MMLALDLLFKWNEQNVDYLNWFIIYQLHTALDIGHLKECMKLCVLFWVSPLYSFNTPCLYWTYVFLFRSAQVPVVCLGEVLFRLVVQLPQEVFCHNVDLRRAVKSVLSCPINCICFGIGSMLLGGMLCEYSWQSCIPFLGVYLVGRLGGIVSNNPLYYVIDYVIKTPFRLSVSIANDGATSFYTQWFGFGLRKRTCQ